MKTSVIGFPRIGRNRELKIVLEKYFRGETDIRQVENLAAQLREQNWKLQQQSGIDWISSNDFSLYDNMLDVAYLFHVIPKRYLDLKLSDPDTYFAMARGYQGEAGNVKALAMKKWFHTNYHYMVPELDDEMEIRRNGDKPLEEYRQAKQLGIETKVVLIGPFTFLKLAHYTGKKTARDFAPVFAKAYAELVRDLQAEGGKVIQFDEPYLSFDLTNQDKQLFMVLYGPILAAKTSAKVLLQTYFGDVRDIYEELIKMDFDALGLDFVEGKQSLKLVQTFGLGKQQVLVAGVVNGRNIWRHNSAKTADLLEALKQCGIDTESRVVLGTSCSLLHVPYTVANENRIPQEYKVHFSFAEEKLNELTRLKTNPLSESKTEEYPVRPDCINPSVRERVEAIRPEDYQRFPDFRTREKIQKDAWNLPLFPTTTIGSFPQTADVRRVRKEYRTGKISHAQYLDYMKEKIKACIALQEEIGLDVLVHGEFERNDMVEYFGQHLDGFLFTENGWVQSYGTRCVKPPIIWGDVSRKAAITVEWSEFAKSCSKHPMKGMLTGPVTILNWSFPREDLPRETCVKQIALAIRDEVLDLEAHGICMIQIDEAALREKLPLRKSDWKEEYLDWAIPAFRLVHSGVKPTTQIHTHMCYSEFGDMIPEIDAMDADVISFEASRSDLQILDALKANDFKTQVGPGVYDIHSPRVPSVEEIVETVHKIRARIPDYKIWINPDCGLKTRGEKETVASLQNLVAAAHVLRKV